MGRKQDDLQKPGVAHLVQSDGRGAHNDLVPGSAGDMGRRPPQRRWGGGAFGGSDVYVEVMRNARGRGVRRRAEEAHGRMGWGS